LAVTGFYIYDNRVFEYIKNCDPNYSGRGELEITEVNNKYLKDKKLKWAMLDGYWLDAGTFDTLLKANLYWARKGGFHE
jgi:glucose-1-phosphate thymidylyltransferase